MDQVAVSIAIANKLTASADVACGMRRWADAAPSL